MERSESRITTGQPVKFEDLIIELGDAYGVSDESLRAMLSRFDPQDSVIVDFPVPPDEDQMGVISIRKASSPEINQSMEGYQIYVFMQNGQLYLDEHYGYPGHLTSNETRELAALIKGQPQTSAEEKKLSQLSFNFRYPVHPSERERRREAVHNPVSIGDYISFNVPLAFEDAFNQLCKLYSVCYDSSLAEVRKGLGGFEKRNVQISLLLAGNDKLPNILQMTSVPEVGEKPLSANIYPVAFKAEHAGVDYVLKIEYGVPEALTPSEEAEYRTLFFTPRSGQDQNDILGRLFELWAIKRGTLTREEATELRAAGTLDTDSPDRTQFLGAKAVGYGFKSVEEWKKAQGWRRES